MALVAFFALFVYEARSWKLEARLYPWVVGISMLVLAVAHLIRGWSRDGSRPLRPTGSFSLEAPLATDPASASDEEGARRRALGVFVWSLGLLLGIGVLGFVVGVPLFLLLHLRVESREPWGLSLALAGITGLAFWGLFVWFMHLPFPDGMVLSWLGSR